MFQTNTARFQNDYARRGYAFTYHTGRTNRCPGCGRSQWLIGRSLAECVFCATALPLSDDVDRRVFEAGIA